MHLSRFTGCMGLELTQNFNNSRKQQRTLDWKYSFGTVFEFTGDAKMSKKNTVISVVLFPNYNCR